MNREVNKERIKLRALTELEVIQEILYHLDVEDMEEDADFEVVSEALEEAAVKLETLAAELQGLARDPNYRL